MIRSGEGNDRFLKNSAQTAILDIVRVQKAITRSELSHLIGVSPEAVDDLLYSLTEEGYIYESGIDASGENLLSLKPNSLYSIGVDLDVKSINIILLDITGKILCEFTMSMPKPSIFQFVVAKIEKAITEILAKHSIGFDRIVGMGISIPGLVDSKTQEIVLAPNLGWHNIDIGSDFARHFNIPVFVENDSMCMAICENWMGACRNISDFVCINIRVGIGTGIFTNGKPYRGAGGSAGEVGHIVVDENGPRCGCGNYGCLGVMASISSIVERTKKVLSQGAVSSLNQFDDVDGISIDHIIQAARGGDDLAKGILGESSRYIGIAICHILNVLNPEKIVIGKEFLRFSDLVMENIQNVVYSRALKFPIMNVEMISSEMGENATTLGAAIVPLRALFGK